ncbi:MAG TPA: hypothetical protein DCE80_10080 [Ignavibacteriales bacterium]|nr:hypothetical protein [Ignavibacteriales bacterium]
MKVYAISMDRNLVAIGFRRVVSCGKKAGFNIKSIYFLDNIWKASFAGSWWKQKTGEGFSVNYVKNDEAILRLANIISDADVIAISLMSVQRNIAKKLCMEVKKNNPNVKIIIGGYHPTLFPGDAISFSDVICQGEGERTFVEFLKRVENKETFYGLKNTWIRNNEEIIKNPRGSLMTPEEVETMPFMEYSLEEQYLFSYAHGILKPMEEKDVIHHVGTTYNTIWSVGCPFRCSFCSQPKFIELDKSYALYRGPSPSYIISEIKEALNNFPLDYIIFYDSNFLGRDFKTLAEFAEKFRKEIGLKFVLSGTNPVSIEEEKMKVLIDGGLVRIKMGFESGNDYSLKLFKRPASTKQIKKAAETLSKFKGKMVAPAFEMIVDNPFETNEHLYQTIDFLDKIPGPFTVSLFSLQFMPGTALTEQVDDFKVVEEHMDKEYMFSYKPTAINLLISIFAIFKPPHFLVKLLKKIVNGKEEKYFPCLKVFLYKSMLVRRAINQAKYGDFSTFPYWVMMIYHRYRRFTSFGI